MRTCFASCLFAGLFISAIYSANDPYIDKLKGIYQYATWVDSTKTNYLQQIQNWNPDISLYGATNIEIQELGKVYGNSRVSFYVFQTTNTPYDVYLKITEEPSIHDAHEALMEFFSTCSAIQPFPTGASIGVNLGDHCYTGYPIGATNSVTFVRNNVLIDISSGEPPASVFEIAKKIDQQLLTISCAPK